jgi:hypothetical protein
MLSPDPRLHAAVEVLTGQKLVEIARYLRKRERVIETADAPPKITQQLVVDVFPAEFLGEFNASEPLSLEKLTEHVLEHVDLKAEAAKVLRRCFLAAISAFTIE